MAYCKKFANSMSPDIMGCLMILHYDGGLNQRERDRLRDDLCRNRSKATIYIGRMNLLQKSPPKSLPPEARDIYRHIKVNSVMVFGPPCSGWWSEMVHTIKDLGLYQKGKLCADHFFAGYISLPTDDIFRYLDAAQCPDPGHPLVDLDHIGYPEIWLDYLSPDYQDIWLEYIGPPVLDYQAVSPESSTLRVHTFRGSILENPMATRLPGENKDDMIDKAHKRFYAKLRLAIMGLLQKSYSCVSFEIARALHQLSARGLSTFIIYSIDAVFTEMAGELLNQILSLESAEKMEILASLWDVGFLDRCKSFLSAVSPDFLERIGMVFQNCIILSRGLDFSRSLLGLVIPGGSGHQPLVRRVTRLLITLGEDVYVDAFEKPFFDKLASLAVEELYALIADDDDLDSWSSYLVDDSSRLKLVTILREVLLANESDQLVLYLLGGSMNEDITSSLVRIGTMYRNLSRSVVGGLVLFTWVQGCFDRCISTFPEDPSCTAEPVHLVEEIITAARNCKLAIKSHLHQNLDLFQYVNARLAQLLNGSERYAEYISLFADEKLRKGPEGAAALDDVSAVVGLLKNKDIFEGFYLKHLAKRVAYGRSGLEPESLMISKLKASTSTVFARKADSLIADALKSAVIMKDFEMGSTSHVPTLSVAVFDCRSWPLSSQTCRPPADAVHEAKNFENHYRTVADHSNNRVLKWLADFGSAVIECNFVSGTHDIEVSTMEMHVLMLFNASDCLSFEDIQKATGIPLSDLKEPLQSLWKRSILLSDVRNGLTFFSVNESYCPCPHSGRLCPPQTQSAKESKLEFVETLCTVEANRRYPIEAAVVRFMKAHKRLLHSELVARVVEALQRYFEADVGQIKDRIESLMEREYLKRDSDNPEFCLYLE